MELNLTEPTLSTVPSIKPYYTSDLLQVVKYHSSLAGRNQNNFLADLGYESSVELQQELLEKDIAALGFSSTEEALKCMGYVKTVEKPTIKRTEKKKADEEFDLVWNT